MNMLNLIRDDEDLVDPHDERTLRSGAGAEARLVETEEGERLEVRDTQGQIVFEYDPETGRSVLSVPRGDLALRAPDGYIDLLAGRGVRCSSVGDIEFQSASRVGLSVPGAKGQGVGLELGRGAVDLRAPRIGLWTQLAMMRADSMRYRGDTLDAQVERVKFVAEKIESLLGRVIERAKNVYHYVEELHQLRAGRTRTHVEGSSLLYADEAVVQARGPVKIDGERIHLG